VLFVSVVYMEIVLEPSVVSDCLKTFLDDPQMARAYQRPSTEANQEVNFIKYMIILGMFVVKCRVQNFLLNYSCTLICIEKYLVNYSYFDSCSRFGRLLLRTCEWIFEFPTSLAILTGHCGMGYIYFMTI
jgi:hypothetical protein